MLLRAVVVLTERQRAGRTRRRAKRNAFHFTSHFTSQADDSPVTNLARFSRSPLESTLLPMDDVTCDHLVDQSYRSLSLAIERILKQTWNQEFKQSCLALLEINNTSQVETAMMTKLQQVIYNSSRRKRDRVENGEFLQGRYHERFKRSKI